MSASQSQVTGTSWTKKSLTITLSLGKGTFGTTGANTVKLENLRMIVSVEKKGFPSLDRAEARVYGLTPDVMNSVSTLGIPLTMWRPGNAMLIEAGDEGGAMYTVYNGYLHQAFQDFSEVPETSMIFVGWGGQAQAITPTNAVSYSGATDAATVAKAIADSAGWTFENNGVNVQLSNPYFWGTPLQQAHDLARAAGIEVYLDTGNNPLKLAIWPRNATRSGPKPLISTRSGLTRYPKFQSNGMLFQCLFNPSIRLGGQIVMESSVGNTTGKIEIGSIGSSASPQTVQGGPNGDWYVISPLVYDLSSQLPSGPWFCEVMCARTNILASQA